MSTGVVVDHEVVSSFNDFKLRKGKFDLRFITYKIGPDKKSIIIDKLGPRSNTYAEFVDALPEDDCRYAVIDLEFETGDGRPTSKLVFISWVPDIVKIRLKMIYSGSKEAIKSVLNGVGIHLNATDFSELDLETSILPAVRRFS